MDTLSQPYILQLAQEDVFRRAEAGLVSIHRRIDNTTAEIVTATYMVVKIRWEDVSVTFGWMSVTPNMPN